MIEERDTFIDDHQRKTYRLLHRTCSQLLIVRKYASRISSTIFLVRSTRQKGHTRVIVFCKWTAIEKLPLMMDMTSGVSSPVPKQGKYQFTDKLVFRVFVVAGCQREIVVLLSLHTRPRMQPREKAGEMEGA
jgi:hypothetical protein